MTSAADILVIAFANLADEEQDEVFRRVDELRQRRLTEQGDLDACYVDALRRVAEIAGKDPSPDDYRRIRLELRASGEELPEFNRVAKRWGTWRLAKEAARLAEGGLTMKQIDARFQKRTLGKVHAFSEHTLHDTLHRCADFYRHPPLVAEFKAWRDRELELARAAGQPCVLPSDSPYRRRYGSWENALLHFGFTPESYALVLEAGRERSSAAVQAHRFQRA